MFVDAGRGIMYELYNFHTILHYRAGIDNRFSEGIRTCHDVFSIDFTNKGEKRLQHAQLK
jgi:hypothetical protein